MIKNILVGWLILCFAFPGMLLTLPQEKQSTKMSFSGGNYYLRGFSQPAFQQEPEFDIDIRYLTKGEIAPYDGGLLNLDALRKVRNWKIDLDKLREEVRLCNIIIVAKSEFIESQKKFIEKQKLAYSNLETKYQDKLKEVERYLNPPFYKKWWFWMATGIVLAYTSVYLAKKA